MRQNKSIYFKIVSRKFIDTIKSDGDFIFGKTFSQSGLHLFEREGRLRADKSDGAFAEFGIVFGKNDGFEDFGKGEKFPFDFFGLNVFAAGNEHPIFAPFDEELVIFPGAEIAGSKPIGRRRLAEISFEKARAADADFAVGSEAQFALRQDVVIEHDHGAHFGEAVGDRDGKVFGIGGDGGAAEEKAAEVFVDGSGAIEMRGDVGEMGDVGRIVEDDGGSGEDAAEDNADAADVIEGQCEAPLVIGAQIESGESTAGVGEETRKGEEGDFWFASGTGSVEEKGARGRMRDEGSLGEAGIDGEEALVAAPCGKERGDEREAWQLFDEERRRRELIDVAIELGKGERGVA